MPMEKEDRFLVESVRNSHLDVMTEAPSLGDEANSPPPLSHHRHVSMPSKMSYTLEPPSGLGFKRLWSRRRSSFNPNAPQLTLSHYLTKEVIPNLDYYWMSVGGAGNLWRHVMFKLELKAQVNFSGPLENVCNCKCSCNSTEPYLI